jgi:hypothetical protein
LTRWGLILLIGYVVIGLSIAERRRAVRYAVWLTAIVIGFVGLRNGPL